MFFFFSSRRRHTRWPRDWSSDVCSSDLQPKAIKRLVEQIQAGQRHQTLLGATGTGKTFTISNVVNEIHRPTLVMAHNKTLAGQLYSEFKEYFPNNAVEYFVSFYDYYKPELYVSSYDTCIEQNT